MKQLHIYIFLLMPLFIIAQTNSVAITTVNNNALQTKSAATKSTSISIPILPNELWWGGAVNDGYSMPYQEGFSYNMYGDNKGNQVQPLLISNKGRVVWSEQPFKFTFSKTAILI